MARLPRISLADHPHHVVQRGNNRQAVFADDGDYEAMLELLRLESRQFGIAVHAYVLMPNHFHLLVTPASADALSPMMQAIGRRYVRGFNTRHERSGTLWEGRYRSNLLQPETYLLPCMAYFDLNPVRARTAESAADYPWTSYRHYAGLRHEAWLAPHPLYWALGNTPFAREAAYAELVRSGVSAAQVDQLTRSALGGWALGDAGYVENLQKSVDRRLSIARPGRPIVKTGLV